jgi:hypothetical protein
LGEYQPRNPTATTKIHDRSILGNSSGDRLGKTQRVEKMLLERRGTNRSDPLGLQQTAVQI